jgi:hypothetical protein
MSDKLSADVDHDTTHNEKHTIHDTKDLSETAGRRASVALNIVQNPLKVNHATLGPPILRNLLNPVLHSELLAFPMCCRWPRLCRTARHA